MKINVSEDNKHRGVDFYDLRARTAYQYTTEDGHTYTIIPLTVSSKLFPPTVMRFYSGGFEVINLQLASVATLRSWEGTKFVKYNGVITLDCSGD